MTTWLLFDVNFLAYRALHSTGQLSFQDNPTGVIYGVLAEVLRCIDRFGTLQCCFCFDFGKPHRTKYLPGYKSTRKAKRRTATPEEKEVHREMKKQLHAMRTKVLHDIGFRNIFYEDGFEADDVIASLANSIPPPHSSVIISSDEDLFQLISPTTIIFNPNKSSIINLDVFRKTYGIDPAQWPDVKAIAGCKGDDVPGVSGVGNVKAIQYLTGKMNKGVVFDRIVANNKCWKDNLSLVRLPFRGTPTFQRKKDKLTVTKWRSVMDEFGFTSLSANPPV